MPVSKSLEKHLTLFWGILLVTLVVPDSLSGQLVLSECNIFFLTMTSLSKVALCWDAGSTMIHMFSLLTPPGRGGFRRFPLFRRIPWSERANSTRSASSARPLTPCLVGRFGSPTKIDVLKKIGYQLILTSPQENLGHLFHWPRYMHNPDAFGYLQFAPFGSTEPCRNVFWLARFVLAQVYQAEAPAWPFSMQFGPGLRGAHPLRCVSVPQMGFPPATTANLQRGPVRI